MRLGRTAEPFAQSEAVVRLEARPKWPTLRRHLRRPFHRRRHPGAMGRGRPRLSACAVRLTDMTLWQKSGLFSMNQRHQLLTDTVSVIEDGHWACPARGLSRSPDLPSLKRLSSLVLSRHESRDTRDADRSRDSSLLLVHFDPRWAGWARAAADVTFSQSTERDSDVSGQTEEQEATHKGHKKSK